MVFMRHEDRHRPVVYSKQQLVDFRRQMLVIHGQQFVIVVCLTGVMVAALFAAATGRYVLGFSRGVWSVATALALLALLVFNITRWRCPGCRRFLGGRNHYASHCRTCGLPIRWWVWSQGRGRRTTG